MGKKVCPGVHMTLPEERYVLACGGEWHSSGRGGPRGPGYPGVCQACVREVYRIREEFILGSPAAELRDSHAITAGDAFLYAVDPFLYRIKTRMVRAKERAKQQGREFSLYTNHGAEAVAESIWRDHLERWGHNCPLLGVPLDCEVGGADTGRRRRHAPSIDRIDSSLGYVPGNVWFISWMANRIKTDATAEELTTFSQNWLKHHSKERL